MSHPEFAHIGDPIDRAIEEMGELILALMKARRFGWFSYHPDRPESTNMDDVRREMEDVNQSLDRLDTHLRAVRFEHFNGKEHEQ
ncbi:nucleoside triphosphate pyrophosphohydrolase family protein [Burkholderia pseudomallei]|uniref:hypothetical protein n=1 Tax=Burkholderia pseudomallei TaxID=28450 RepID=UPI000537DEFE|nr:hypothetical protein [Burkholderia pseudomallei]KGX19631.1 hypothetical protein X896_727 [Burkholderia pseudomallei ABCPW 1]